MPSFNDVAFYLIILIALILLCIIFSMSNQEHMTPSNDVQNMGTLNVNNLNVSGSFNLLPTGSIIAWSGSQAPQGWQLCDGTNGTPDLRGRFILGAGQGLGLTGRTIGQIGGEENHLLNVNELPNHNHSGVVGRQNTCSNGNYSSVSCLYGPPQKQPYFASDWTNTANTGGNQPHNNMPPYYVLAFIMKL